MSSDQRMQAVAARIEALVGYFADSPEPHVRRNGQELVTLLLELYGTGLERILRILEREDGSAGRRPGIEALLRDELIASLFVLHDLHPEDCAARISRELERIGEFAGADVTLLGVTAATARVQLHEQRHARARSAPELRRLIEGVVQAAAPEVDRVEIEGLADTDSPPLVQLTRKPSRDRHDEMPFR
jgi:hypothetical protein